MYLFLDESKKINGGIGKIVFGGLLTTLKPSTIDSIYKEYLIIEGIKEKGGEIKSTDTKYEDKLSHFYKYIINHKEYRNIEFIGLFSDNYKECGHNYYLIIKTY